MGVIMMDLTHGLPISIHLETKVMQHGETADFLYDLTGQIIKMGDILYIRYKEIQEDTKEEIPVTVKIEPDGSVQLTRSGEIRTRLKFSYHETVETSYRTPYGMFQIQTYTHHLRFSLKDRPISGRVIVDYDLLSMNEKVGEYHFTLSFTA